jgi:hypothetical protein
LHGGWLGHTGLVSKERKKERKDAKMQRRKVTKGKPLRLCIFALQLFDRPILAISPAVVKNSVSLAIVQALQTISQVDQFADPVI